MGSEETTKGQDAPAAAPVLRCRNLTGDTMCSIMNLETCPFIESGMPMDECEIFEPLT